MQLAKVDSASVRMDSEEMASNALVSSFFLYILVKLYFFVPFVVLKYNKSPIYFVAEDNFNCFYFLVFIISFCSYSALEAIKDPCVPNPCRNNGTCSKGPDESFDCTCPEGFSPLFAQVSDISFRIRGNNNGRLEISVIKAITGLLFGK